MPTFLCVASFADAGKMQLMAIVSAVLAGASMRVMRKLRRGNTRQDGNGAKEE